MADDRHVYQFLKQLSARHGGGEHAVESRTAPYKGGDQNRLWRDWEPDPLSGDAAISENWGLMTSRVRDLFRNEAVIRKLRREIAKGVVGRGIATFADVVEPGIDGEPDDEFNFEADEQFERWCEEDCDVEGRQAWEQMQWQHFNEVEESGESFLLECWEPEKSRTSPLCYQLLEPEQIDETKDWPADDKGIRAVRGIEYDRRGRAVAYWIHDVHPHDVHGAGLSTDSTRVPARRVIHSFLPNRSSENRGVTWFSANVQYAKDVDWYLGNELTAAALGAALALVVKRESGQGSGTGFAGGAHSTSGGTDANGNSVVKLGRPFIADIGPNDDVAIAESKRPNRDAKPFIDLLMMLHGMASGVSQLRVTGDYKQTSYTAARGAHLDDQAYFVVLQQWAARSFIRPVRRRFHAVQAGLGRFRSVGARQFQKNAHDFQRLTIQPPGREQLDPDSETSSAVARIRGNLSTWQIECGLRGHNWRRLALQKKRELAFFARHGLPVDLTTGNAAPASSSKTRTEETADAEAGE